ncbi:hypothetical protein NCS52_00910700 [Fusarium sp. LHS14.1]|nr:hypothetical protein NCS52_00910700 [Fusarium sp. LHS14.1]
MNNNTGISKNGCKPRGRPRKRPSDDHKMNALRERNREAQKSFRLRHKSQRQGEVELDHKFDHLLSVFLSFTDQVVHSERATRDESLMKALRSSVKDVLSLTNDTPEKALRNSLQSNQESTAIRNNKTTPDEVFMSREGSNIQLQPSLSSQPFERQSSGVQVGESEQRIRQNIGPSASVTFQPPSTGQYRLDSPFSLQIAYLTIQYACHILSATTSPASDALYQAFGSRLKIHTREDILLHLRWHLGPGYSHLDCLATATFTEPVVINTGEELEDRQLYNADQIARILRQRTHELAGGDCLDVIVNNGMSAMSNLVHAPTTQRQIIKYSNSEAAVIIRVSKLGLLHNISRSGICYGSGPGFLGADVKKAIWDSVLPWSFFA